MASLVFTPVDNAEIPLLLKALTLDNPSKLHILEDLVGRGRLEFSSDSAKLVSKKTVVKALASLACPSLLGCTIDEKIAVILL